MRVCLCVRAMCSHMFLRVDRVCNCYAPRIWILRVNTDILTYRSIIKACLQFVAYRIEFLCWTWTSSAFHACVKFRILNSFFLFINKTKQWKKKSKTNFSIWKNPGPYDAKCRPAVIYEWKYAHIRIYCLAVFRHFFFMRIYAIFLVERVKEFQSGKNG